MTPGIYYDMPAEVYHADPCDGPSLSNSVAKRLVTRSPLHAFHAHPKLGGSSAPEDDEEDADGKLNYGSACHDVLLEGGAKLLVIAPEDYPSKPKKAGEPGSIPKGWTNNAIREARDNAKAAGRIPVLPPQGNRIAAMVEAAKHYLSQCDIGELWLDSKSEVTLIWQDNGIWCRARADRLHSSNRWIGDYKSTKDASPDSFSRQIIRMGYDFQDAFYRRGLRALGHDNPQFSFLAQEIMAPYACSIHACHQALKEIADAQVEYAIKTWAKCLREKHWPGYSGMLTVAEPTAWQLADHEMALAMEGEE